MTNTEVKKTKNSLVIGHRIQTEDFAILLSAIGGGLTSQILAVIVVRLRTTLSWFRWRV